MPRSHSKKLRRMLFGVLILLLSAFLMTGCGSGDDGDTGPAGPSGPEGPPGPAGPPSGAVVDLSTMTVEQQAELGTVSMKPDSISVSIDSPPEVTFALVDDLGRPVDGLDSIAENIYDNVIRFTLVKLVAGSDGNPDSWHSYIVSNTGEPTYDSPNHGGVLVANGDNTYTYTFAADVGSDPAYDPTVTHRLAGQIGGGDTGFEPSNFVFDFVPDGSPVTHDRNVAMTASCNECHDPLAIHGRRTEVGYCVTCHNPGLAEGEGNLAYLAHTIHSGGKFENITDRSGNALDYSEVTYPQDLRNCRKCHNGDDQATPQGNNWKTVQTASLCFMQCHGVPDRVLENASFHTNIIGNCDACHNNQIVPVLDIDKIHTTANATENNPGLLKGERKIEYEIDKAVLQGNMLTITFRILSNGTAMNLKSLPAGLSGSPSFLFAYALPQDGISQPADFNNLGRSAGQPQAISIANLADGSAGNLTFASGTCTATLPNPYPAGASMRTVGLQGYYQQNVAGETISLHTKSVVKTVAGNTPRRDIADSFGCGACHEIFEGHGGNRVFTADGGVQICTMCHNQNLTSSGRANATPIAGAGPNPIDYPEATNNLKDMIHGIHAADFRASAYEFVRGGSHGGFYDWSEVTFPGNLANCTKCHLDTSYLPDEVPENALMSTDRITGVMSGMDATSADVAAARDTVPNDTDWVITPIAGACYACHNSLADMSHMEQFGGAIDWNRGSVDTVDTCAICHGPGNIADVTKAHGLMD